MFIIKYRKIFLAISGILMVASLGAVMYFGLNLGIEFTGGSFSQVSYEEGNIPTFSQIEESLNNFDTERGFVIQEVGEGGYIIRTTHLNEEEREGMIGALSFGDFEVTEERFSSIGPSIGNELRDKSLIALILSSIVIVLFITYVFRRVSKPVSSWKYGATAVLALIHDILIPVGVFAVLGYFLGAEIDVLFVTALLAVIGFSVNDTIVIFDRIRENLSLNEEYNIKKSFADTVGESLRQSYARSINTSLTTLLVLGALYFLGGAVTQFFALVLMIGVVAGTYSSLFMASPILVFLAGKKGEK